MATKPVAAIDIDEVLFPYLCTLVRYVNRTRGQRHQLEKFWTHQTHFIFGVQPEVVYGYYAEFEATQEFANIQPLPDAVARVPVLAEHFTLVACTSRVSSHRELTERQLATHFPGCFADLRFGRKGTHYDPAVNKTTLVPEARLAIDDQTNHIMDYQAAGINALLFGDYPWNRQSEKYKAVRVNDWHAVLEHPHVVCVRAPPR